MTIKIRPLGEDIEPAVDLLLRCQTSRPMDKWPAVQEFRLLLSSSSSEEATAAFWIDANDKEVGFARLAVSGSTANLMLIAEPRTDSIDSAILEWALAHLTEDSQRSGETIRLYVRPVETDVSLIILLGELGFAQEDWHVVRMTRSLDEPIPEPSFSDGFAIRPLAGESEVEAYVAMHREAFGTEIMTVTERLDFMRSPTYVPSLDLVAVAPGGTLAAFVVGVIDTEEMNRLGWKQGWADPVGTRPAFQRKGLARALLLTQFRRLKERGVSTAITGTGSWNTPMLSLGEAVGFRVLHKVLAYSKVVSASTKDRF